MTTMSPALAAFAQSRHADAPQHLGTRYDTAGVFLPEPGNTIVCNVQPGTETQAVLFEIRDRFRDRPDAHKLAFTAPESLHMTLLDGVIMSRRLPAHWPAGVSVDTSLDDMDALFLERLRAFTPGPRFNVEAVEVRPTGLGVDGVTAEDRRIMRDWRNRLSDLMGFRHPNHDSYAFHLTMAYPIAWFDDADLPAWQDLFDQALVDIRRRAPVLELRAPAFCRYDDMNWFEELLVFEPAA